MRPLNVTDGHPAVCACGPCADSAVNAMIQEGSDAAAGTATSYRMSVGDSFKGNLAWIGDRDWVAIELSAGDHYEFGLSGQASGAGTLGDPYLRLYDSSGLLVVDNDDGGVGFDSLLTYTANRSGTYYIAAGSYADRWTGTYTMTADSTALPEPGGFSDLADYLVNGFWEWFGQSARQWNTSVSNVVTVDIGGLTAEGQQLARWAMEAWEYVIDIDFREDDSNAMLVFDDEEDGAYSASVVSGGYIQSSQINISADWLASYGTSLDSYSFQTYVSHPGR
jgi:serralysin